MNVLTITTVALVGLMVAGCAAPTGPRKTWGQAMQETLDNFNRMAPPPSREIVCETDRGLGGTSTTRCRER